MRVRLGGRFGVRGLGWIVVLFGSAVLAAMRLPGWCCLGFPGTCYQGARPQHVNAGPLWPALGRPFGLLRLSMFARRRLSDCACSVIGGWACWLTRLGRLRRWLAAGGRRSPRAGGVGALLSGLAPCSR